MVKQPKIAVVGAGLVGAGWTLVFARAGYETRVFDPDPKVRDSVFSWAADTAAELHDFGLAGPAESVLPNIKIVDRLDEALDGADYVQESVYETLDAKIDVSRDIDAALNEGAVVGSSTSGFPASKFTQDCRNRDRFLVAHPVNPPHLVPVVELVPAPWTCPDALAFVRDLMDELGQMPVTLTSEVDGFILNRLQGALLNEAFALYADGLASLRDIDATISHGLGLRWCFMGPFETIDLNAPGGLADYADRLGAMYFHFAQQRTPAPWDKDAVQSAHRDLRATSDTTALHHRRGWRDGVLMRLAKFKLDQNLSTAARKANGLNALEGNSP